MADGSQASIAHVDERTLGRLRQMVERWSPADRIAVSGLLRSSTDLGGRTPPNNIEAENSVLSAMLTEGGKVLDETLDVLPTGEPFYSDANKRIWDVAIGLHGAGTAVDITTISDVLNRTGRLQAVGGITYMTRIVDSTPGIAHVRAHAEIVAEKFRMRRLIETCMIIAAKAHGDYGRASLFIADAVESVSEIAERGLKTRIQSLEELGRERDAEVAAQWNGERDPWGMRGPHEKLHALMHGYGLTEQTYLAGDTGSGKSAFANQVMLDLAGRVYDGRAIACGAISLEMRSTKHYDRAVLHVAHGLAIAHRIAPVTMYELMSGLREGSKTERLQYDQIAIIEEARRVVRAKPIFFEDSDHDLVKVRQTFRGMQRRAEAVGAVLRFGEIDHMHIMNFPDEETEASALAAMVKGFNEIAKEFNIHLLVLAQFGTKTDAREVPVLGDIRGAAAIRQIAHKAILIHRPWTRMSLKQKSEATEEQKRKAHAILAKHRDGQEGVIEMMFTGPAFRFDETS